MKAMDGLGRPLFGYEGIADAVFENDDTKIEAGGYFELRQFPSGRIAITIVPTNLSLPDNVTVRSDGNPRLSFHGRDLDGWELRPKGELSFFRLGWLMAPMRRPPIQLNVDAQMLEAKGQGATETGYTKTRFLLSNLLWHESDGDEPEPLKLVCPEYEVSVDPVPDYAEVSSRLISMGGVEPTALVPLNAPRASHKQLGALPNSWTI